MSVCTNVAPFDSIEAGSETVDFLREMGISIPEAGGRAPFLEELLEVLGTFSGVRIESEMPHPGGEFLTILFGERDSEIDLQIEGERDASGAVSFWFRDAGSEWTMLAILKRLSQRCGPQLMWTELRDDFSIVTSETNIELECSRRSERWNAQYPNGPRSRVVRPPPPISEA